MGVWWLLHLNSVEKASSPSLTSQCVQRGGLIPSPFHSGIHQILSIHRPSVHPSVLLTTSLASFLPPLSLPKMLHLDHPSGNPDTNLSLTSPHSSVRQVPLQAQITAATWVKSYLFSSCPSLSHEPKLPSQPHPQALSTWVSLSPPPPRKEGLSTPLAVVRAS